MRQMHVVSLLRAMTWRELAGLAIGVLLLASIAKRLAPEAVSRCCIMPVSRCRCCC
jgi:hypothetical protein